ncbi:hypothetical protein [Amaricoccus sp.]|uniref:hypothetical protein n=1 Tax=Amaricoccus sp. TaxID=1872485 RepID=UPI001B68B60B|nr:hypothetical protein [Amaricoccus sp.]MBP7002832.1 hypothetical protein [Amaricoccus sp.]
MTVRTEFRSFRDPLEIVDRTDIDYAERLEILQAWKAELGRGDAPEAEHERIAGAIHALEMGAAVQNDEPAEAPKAHGYGVPDETGPGDVASGGRSDEP